MAIDTANKRSSAINVGSPWRSRLPFPDGTIDQGDRQHVAFMYSGIAAGAATPQLPSEVFTARPRGEVFTARPRGQVFSSRDR